MTLAKVISGGQTGVDQGSLRAAKAAGIPTGGWAARGWLTEDGPAPWLGSEFQLEDSPVDGYPARTRMNARDSDATVWIGAGDSAGFHCTRRACSEFNRPMFVVTGGIATPKMVAGWIASNGFRVVNFAGNRESKRTGIGARAEEFLGRVFAILKREEGE